MHRRVDGTRLDVEAPTRRGRHCWMRLWAASCGVTAALWWAAHTSGRRGHSGNSAPRLRIQGRRQRSHSSDRVGSRGRVSQGPRSRHACCRTPQDNECGRITACRPAAAGRRCNRGRGRNTTTHKASDCQSRRASNAGIALGVPLRRRVARSPREQWNGPESSICAPCAGLVDRRRPRTAPRGGQLWTTVSRGAHGRCAAG